MSHLLGGKRERRSKLRTEDEHFRPTVSVVIPARNEAPNLRWVLPRIPRGVVDEVIVVDGNSTDGTPAVARELWPGVRVLRDQGGGKGEAVRLGLEAAECQFV